jgi:hypothetical protein
MNEMKMEEIKQMMLDRVPRREIALRTGCSQSELAHFAQAWGIPPYGKPGRPRKERRESDSVGPSKATASATAASLSGP